MMKKYILFIVLILQSILCMAQLDKEFWFAPPAATDCDPHPEKSHALYFYTYDQAADIVIERFAPTLILDTIHLAANSHRVYLMDMYNTAPYSRITPYGIHITSTALINCCYHLRLPEQEIVTMKGRSALGCDFIVPGQSVFNCVGESHNTAEIIASRNNTTIQITTPVALTDGTAPGETFSITLQRGEVYHLRADNTISTGKLTNTRIHSDKPIAVCTSDMAIYPSHSSFISEQIVPLNLWSTRYLSIGETTPNPFESNYACIIASQDSTMVHVTAPDTSFMLNLGEYADIQLVQYTPIHNITADKPICVLQLSRFSNGYGAYVLPGLECNGSREVTTDLVDRNTSLIFGPYSYFIIAHTADTGNFIFNGVPSAQFRPIPGDTTLWYAHYAAATAADSANIKCTSGFFTFYECVAYNHNRYSTTSTCRSNYAPLSHLRFNSDTTDFCVGGEIRFHLDNLYMDSVVLWGANSLRIENPSADFSIPATDTNQSGWYYITGQDSVQCLQAQTDSIYIRVLQPFVGDIFDTIVENQLPHYHNGHEFTSAVSDTTIICTSPALECDSVVNYHLYVYPNITDTVDYYICEGELPFSIGGITMEEEGTRFLGTSTGIHGEDSTSFVTLHIIASSEVEIRDSIVEEQLPWFALDTVFTDTVADYIYQAYNEAGCDSIVHYYLHIFWNGDHCDTNLSYPNVVTPNGDGNNDRFIIQGLLENACYRYNELAIFDRTGRCIFRKNIASDEDWWDPAADRTPTGTYFYVFKAHGVNIHTLHKGVIEVLREK